MPINIPSAPASFDQTSWQAWANAVRGELERYGRETSSAGIISLPINNVSGAPATYSLPNSHVQVDAKDVAGTANANNITFNTLDGSLIDGAPAFVMTLNYQFVSFRWNGSGWNVF